MKENQINASSMSFMKIKTSYWVAAAIATALVSSALIVNAYISANNDPSQSQKGQIMSQVSRSQTVDFRFEDYETAAAAQEKLQSLFPISSDVDRFTDAMADLGAECHPSVNEDEENIVYCYYSQKPNFLVRTQWIVGTKFDNDRKIKAFTKVERGFVGP